MDGLISTIRASNFERQSLENRTIVNDWIGTSIITLDIESRVVCLYFLNLMLESYVSIYVPYIFWAGSPWLSFFVSFRRVDKCF